ncbi:choice-of-anchor K domain-containing protein [Prosthecobacter sp. SYSU 5D2]|uniref:choice-of-anchor K domain-containing protein n=1 Tax=Prosthecobacter sp. SYSU 5D2 TaxID=3134134 RepID=UPI0031FEA8A7
METAARHSFHSAPPARRSRLGFSVMELVVLIAIMGVLITVVVTMMGSQPVAVRNAKLASDVATLNQMVSVYVSDGGRLAGLTNAQTVLDRLKKARPQAEWKQHTGPVSGRLVDVRLMARTTSTAEKNGQERALWNPKTQRFELTTKGGNAVSEFYLDESLAASQPGTESRTAPVVKYNSAAGKNQGWVWGYSATGNIAYNTPGSNDGKGASNPFDPSQPAPLPDPGDGGDDGAGNDGGGDTGGGDDDPPAPSIKQLPRPRILPDGNRSFPYAAFPASVAISPGDVPAGGSRLDYRVNGGEWKPYSGSPIPLSSGDKVEARNFATDTTLYRTSSPDSDTYYRLVSGFSGSGTGTWGNAAGGSNLVTSVQNGSTSSTFQHGNTKLDLGNGEFLDAGVENVLTFTPGQFETITPNVWFDLGNLVMLNGNTFYNSEASAVTLSINLNLTEPAHSTVVHINLGLISTENTSDRLASADIVELRNPNTDFKVTVDGVEYRLQLGWETLDPGAGVVQGNQFYIYETATASAVLRGRFVPNQ